MAITAANIQDAVRLEVYSAQITERPYVCEINGSITDSGTSIVVDDGTPWAVQDIGEFDDGEQVLVTAVATNTLTVLRGWNGTTAAAQSDNAVFTQNPRFSRAQINQALDHVLDDLRPDLYDLETKTLTYDPTTTWYAFSAGDDARILDVISVYYKATNIAHPTPVDSWKFYRDLDATAFTAALGVAVGPTLSLASGSSLYAIVRKEVQAIADCPDAWKSMLVMGVVYHLMGAQTISRTQDPGRRSDRTVQAGQDARDSIWYLREYIRRRDKLAADIERREGEVPKSRYSARSSRFRR